jgi:hypothetical protein
MDGTMDWLAVDSVRETSRFTQVFFAQEWS